jgi:hypothetical protein
MVAKGIYNVKESGLEFVHDKTTDLPLTPEEFLQEFRYEDKKFLDFL